MLAAAELRELDELMDKVRGAAEAGDPGNLAHALRNLSHAAVLVASILSRSEESGSSRGSGSLLDDPHASNAGT